MREKLTKDLFEEALDKIKKQDIETHNSKFVIIEWWKDNPRLPVEEEES